MKGNNYMDDQSEIEQLVRKSDINHNNSENRKIK